MDVFDISDDSSSLDWTEWVAASLDWKREIESILFYKDLREQSSTPPIKASSQNEIAEVELSHSGGQRIRLMHLTQLLPIDGESAYATYVEAAGFFALKHFNERSNKVVPNLSEMLDGCNIYLTMDMLSSESSPIAASGKLYSYFSREATFQSPQPAAFVGSFFSSVSRPLAVLAGVYGVPIVSPSSTSTGLDDIESAPTFGRTIPTNTGMAEAGVVYLKSLGVTTFAVITARADYGISFSKDISRAASVHGLEVVSVNYELNDPQSMRRAIATLKKADRRYIFGLVTFDDCFDVLEIAYEGGLVGPDNLWILPEIDFITADGFALDRVANPGVAAALQGALVLNFQNVPSAGFEESVSQLQMDPKIQSDFLAIHPEESAYLGVDLNKLTPNLSMFSRTAYDAVMSLGIAACQAESELFTGDELFESFKSTEFEGASGAVSFDPITGTRNFETVPFSFHNVFADDSRSNNSTTVYTSRISTVVDFGADQAVQIVNPTIFSDGSTTAPPPLPPPNLETNRIPISVLSVGLGLLSLLVLSICYLAWWVHKHRRRQIVCASQPEFLYMLLGGTLLIACSILPLTFQGPRPEYGQGVEDLETSLIGLDVACMATPWLFVCGFSAAMSAIFAKALRLKRIVRQAMAVRRASVYAKDVAFPCIVIMATNIVLLIAWTVVSPLVWTRVIVENNYDEFGRPTEVYSLCTGRVDENGKNLSNIFFLLLGVINVLLVIYAFYQVYSTRYMPDQFKEPLHLFLCIAILLEAFLLGAPILFLAQHDPMAAFIVKVLLTTSFCIAILGPNFLPKIYSVRRASTVVTRADNVKQWNTYITEEKRRSSSTLSKKSLRNSSRRASSTTRLDSDSGKKVFEDDSATEDLSNIRPLNSFSDQYFPSSVAELRASIAHKTLYEKAPPLWFDELEDIDMSADSSTRFAHNSSSGVLSPK